MLSPSLAGFRAAVAAVMALAVAVLLSPHASAADPADNWCRGQGGTVVVRNFETSNEQIDLCEFTSTSDQSRIAVAAQTLASDNVTKAQTAYIHPAPSVPPSNGASPAAVYCVQQLGGYERIIQTQGGEAGLCMFDDNSAIDDWGLAYKADGIIGGADLTHRFRASLN